MLFRGCQSDILAYEAVTQMSGSGRWTSLNETFHGCPMAVLLSHARIHRRSYCGSPYRLLSAHARNFGLGGHAKALKSHMGHVAGHGGIGRGVM